MEPALPTRPQSHHHHTVPQFWLKEFADTDKFFKRFKAPGGELIGKRVHVRNATTVDDLYVLDTWSATHDIDEQKIMSPIEREAAKALRPLWDAEDLSTVWPLTDRARNDLAAFLALSVIRTPKYRHDAQIDMEHQVMKSDRPLDFIDLFRSGVIVGDPDDLMRLGRTRGVWREGDQAPSNVQSDYMRAELPKLTRHLFYQRWVLMQAPVPTFVISDNPVALTGQPMTYAGPTFYSVNSRDSRMSITALSRTLLLITDWHPETVLAGLHLNGDGVIPFDAERAGLARATLIINAHREFFEHPDDHIIEDLLARAAT